MQKNLTVKALLIIAILLVFVYGIFGIPGGLSGAALTKSLRERIHLGLDLKGGTHLILQVVVNDAVNGDSDHAPEAGTTPPGRTRTWRPEPRKRRPGRNTPFFHFNYPPATDGNLHL